MPRTNQTTRQDDEKPRRRPPSAATPAPAAAPAAAPVPAAIGVAGFDFAGLNRHFLQRGGSEARNDAAAYGPRIETRGPPSGQTHW